MKWMNEQQSHWILHHCAVFLCYSIWFLCSPFSFQNFSFHFQVNHSPSFTTDSPLDKEIKDGLMYDALNLLNFGACDRRKILEEDKKRVRDRLLQKQRPRENKYVKYQFAAEVVVFTHYRIAFWWLAQMLSSSDHLTLLSNPLFSFLFFFLLFYSCVTSKSSRSDYNW